MEPSHSYSHVSIRLRRGRIRSSSTRLASPPLAPLSCMLLSSLSLLALSTGVQTSRVPVPHCLWRLIMVEGFRDPSIGVKNTGE